MATKICPVAGSRTAQPWPKGLPSGGQVFCPAVQLVNGITS